MSPLICSSFFIFLAVFFSFFAGFRAVDGQNLIHETCKTCAQKDPNLSYNFCVASLQAVPKSGLADLRQLGNISIKLTKHNVTATRHRIKKLLKKKNLDPFVKGCLNDCFELYSDAIPSLKKALKDYKGERYEDANIDVSSVIDAATTCEDGFNERNGVVSPLTKRNNDTFQLSAIALSIINMLS
jgi:pectinesterase inhibitor-like protein